MDYSPGLRGVIAGETSISTVGKEGTSLRYRGYDAIELTKNKTYEEVASLIIQDSLDGDEFKEAFLKKLKETQVVKMKYTDSFGTFPSLTTLPLSLDEDFSDFESDSDEESMGFHETSSR